MNQPDTACRVLIVDDTLAFVELAEALLFEEVWIEVVGYARSGREALEVVGQLRPDFVLMDITMPDMNGLEAARHIKAREPAPWIIIWTAYEEPQYEAAARDAGADGFITKLQAVAQLVMLMRSIIARNAQSA